MKILKSKILWTLVFVVVICIMTIALIGNISSKTTDSQREFIESAVRRSAIQCYVIEGSFPKNEQGIKYLQDNYGLALNEKDFRVYYESMGGNLLPQIRIIDR